MESQRRILGCCSALNMWDYIFPHFCLGCNEEGNIVCTKCQATLCVLGVFVPLEKPTSLDDHVALGIFEETNILARLIYAYKYNFVTDTVPLFANMIGKFLENKKTYFEGIDMLVPVPLHKRRLAERGFNQSEEIAKLLASFVDIPVHNILLRDKATKQQAKLHKQEREKNIQDSFVLKAGSDVKHKNIIVVDDVFTTGSTLGECARILKNAGAKTVKAFTLARG